MDPMQMFQLMQMMHQRQGGGMFGSQQTAMPQQMPAMPQGQMPQQPAMPQGQIPQGQMPPLPGADESQHHHKGGFNPLMLLSPMGGLMASNPKLGMSLMSPAFGIANLLGAFK